MKTVYYLSYSDIPGKDGLIFPNELQSGTYSPGIWVIDLEEFERISDTFIFDAVDNNENQSLKITRVNRSVFQVDTSKYGKFYFRIMRLFFRYEKYVGNSKLIKSDNILYQLVSMDIQKLERICLQNGFFFVGSVDDSIEKSAI